MRGEKQSSEYILYGGGVTRALGPQMVLEEGGLQYELRPIDEHKGEHRTAHYLALNPAGFIPTLVAPDGVVLHEAAAIMLFLAESHGLDHLLPDPGTRGRGRFLSRLFYQTNDIQPAVRRFFKPEQYVRDRSAAATVKDRARATAMERWSVYDGFLDRDGPFAIGEHFTLADLHMTLWAAYGLNQCNTVIDAFPAVRRCFALTAARPKVHPLIEKLQSDMQTWSGSSQI